MTTPDTQVETLEEIAGRIADKFRPRFVRMTTDTEALRDDVFSALRNERERAFREILEIAEHDEPRLVIGYLQAHLGITKTLDEVRTTLKKKVM